MNRAASRCSRTGRPEDDRERAARAREAGRRAGVDAALRRRGDAQARARAGEGVELDARRTRPTSTSASCSAATARSSPRCARYAGTDVPGVRGQLRRGRLPRHGRARRGSREGFDRALRGRLRASCAAGDRARAPGRRSWTAINDVSFHRKPGDARRRARLRGRGRGDRPRALRRARRLHAGGLDGLQPRQRRPGAGLGRARASSSPSSRRTRSRRARSSSPPTTVLTRAQPLARASRSRSRRRPRRRASSPAGERDPSSASRTTRRCSRSCRARASTTACARSSAASRTKATRTLRAPAYGRRTPRSSTPLIHDVLLELRSRTCC